MFTTTYMIVSSLTVGAIVMGYKIEKSWLTSLNDLSRRYAPLRQSSDGRWLHAITALVVLIVSAVAATRMNCGYFFDVGLVIGGVFIGASIASMASAQR
jgi:hypothetical protein